MLFFLTPWRHASVCCLRWVLRRCCQRRVRRGGALCNSTTASYQARQTAVSTHDSARLAAWAVSFHLAPLSRTARRRAYRCIRAPSCRGKVVGRICTYALHARAPSQRAHGAAGPERAAVPTTSPRASRCTEARQLLENRSRRLPLELLASGEARTVVRTNNDIVRRALRSLPGSTRSFSLCL